MRARVRYAKTGKLRFVSAIDLGRLWERALRKAGLPIAYSEGFSPHPKVSFPDALPLGYASTGEYAELTFAAPVALEPAVWDLNAALPGGMTVLDAVEVREGAPRLAKWLRASAWDLRYPPGPEAELAAAVQAVLAADEVIVARDRKGETTDLDLRPAIHRLLTGTDDDSHPTVRATVHHVEPPMRPSEVHQALDRAARSHTGAPLPEPTLVIRVAQGEPTEEGLVEALGGGLVPPHPDSTSQKADSRDRRTDQPGDHGGGVGRADGRTRGAADRRADRPGGPGGRDGRAGGADAERPGGPGGPAGGADAERPGGPGGPAGGADLGPAERSGVG